jgi:hypothetical protein
MKKLTEALLAIVLTVIYQPTLAQIFHENFEIADSVSYYSNSSSNWAPNNRLATSGIYCDSAAIINPGDSIIMTTMQFSTSGMDSVYLYFNHIAKIEFFDLAMIEVSPDGGITWIRLLYDSGMPPTWSNCVYYGASVFNLQSSKFSEASYAGWQPGQAVAPQPDWWRREIFDVSMLLGNKTNAQVRFVLQDLNNSGGAFRNGWFIDDILITDSLDTYLYTFLNTVKGKLYFDMNSNQVHDSGEDLIKNFKVGEVNSPFQDFTDINGEYILRTPTFITPIEWQPDTTIYLVPYLNVSPFVHMVAFPALGMTD